MKTKVDLIALALKNGWTVEETKGIFNRDDKKIGLRVMHPPIYLSPMIIENPLHCCPPKVVWFRDTDSTGG